MQPLFSHYKNRKLLQQEINSLEYLWELHFHSCCIDIPPHVKNSSIRPTRSLNYHIAGISLGTRKSCMTFLCLLTILPGIRLLYDRQHVFLCLHTKFLSVIQHMSRIARCHTFLTMNFAMVLQCLYRIHSCSVDSYRVNKASLSVSIQHYPK